MVTVRPLEDDDLSAVLDFLAPTEHRSVFLAGNASTYGIRDQGEALQGVWVGAFEGGSLCGLIAWFRGPNSITPACEGHAAVLVPALLDRIPAMPFVMVGTRERLAEVYPHLPTSWLVETQQREVLLVLRWEDYRPRGDRSATALPVERVREGAELIGLLHRTWNIPTDEARNMFTAERLTRSGHIFAHDHEGVAIAISCEATSSGRYVHVGATVCVPEHRRQGHARACVSAVIERARAEGRASVGATLFTGEDNHEALALYESMGFRRDALWEMGFFKR